MSTLHSHRPAKGTSTGRVWEIADELTRRSGRRARRADVIQTFVQEGGNPNTGATQYQAWKAAYDSASELKDGSARERFFDLQIKDGGRILLPLDLRELLSAGEGEVLVGEVRDGELLLMTRRTAVRKAQELVRKHVPTGVSLADELIAERRAEAAREEGV